MTIYKAHDWFTSKLKVGDLVSPMYIHHTYWLFSPDLRSRLGRVGRIEVIDGPDILVDGRWYPWYCLDFKNTELPLVFPKKAVYRTTNKHFFPGHTHFRVWREWRCGQFGSYSSGYKDADPDLYQNTQVLTASGGPDLRFESGYGAPFWAIAPVDATFAPTRTSKSVHAQPLPLP